MYLPLQVWTDVFVRDFGESTPNLCFNGGFVN